MSVPAPNDLHGETAYKPLSNDFWAECWADGRAMTWHLTYKHPGLVRNIEALTNGQKHMRIFFPLCGKAVDMKWLYDEGHTIIGVDCSPDAFTQYFEENELPYETEKLGNLGTVYKTPDARLRLYCMDFYDFTTTDAGPLEAVWDSGGLMAVNKDQQKKFVEHLSTFISTKTRLMVETVEFDENEYIGPPYPLDESAMRELYGPGFTVVQLERIDHTKEYANQLPLTTFIKAVYLITRLEENRQS